MSRIIILVILLTITALGSAIGLGWALIQMKWMWSINFFLLFINVLIFSLLSVPAPKEEYKKPEDTSDEE